MTTLPREVLLLWASTTTMEWNKVIFDDEKKFDYLTVTVASATDVLKQGCYQIDGLDGIDAQYRLDGNRIVAIDAGTHTSSDETELMGSAPKFWSITNGNFTGNIELEPMFAGGTLLMWNISSNEVG